MVLRSGAIVLGALISTGCAGRDQQTLAIDEVTATERLLSRHRVIADGVEVRATLWSPELVQRAVETSSGSADSKAKLGRRFTKRYARGPSFTIVVDIARRRPEPMRDQAQLFDPTHWTFTLGESLRPQHVELVAEDRFPTEAGGHHHRLVFDAHFPRATAAKQLELRVHCNAAYGWRKALGRSVARRGVPLRWDG